VERETGASDVLVINGIDPSGRSAIVNVGLPETAQLRGSTHRILRRAAGHVAAAARVRRRIAAGAAVPPAVPATGAEAVFSPERGGRLLHAEGEATGRAQRQQLTQALRLREATRARRRRAEPAESWWPLVDTRWTLVDSYESNGSRYIVARENHADVRSLDVLTDRERQVVASLAFGHTTKETAYALGIDPSTARVLQIRAAAKLGVAGRAGLLDHPAVKAMRGGIDADDL
jgi:DNA-binding CsgD family transcriptional regulator